jgi:hypothetical protein
MGEVVSLLLYKMQKERKRVRERLRREGLELEVPPDFNEKMDKEVEDFLTRNEDEISKLIKLAKNTAMQIDKNKDGSQE